MELIYNGVDITNAVEIARLNVSEDVGRTPDGIELWTVDSQGQWSSWSPKQGDVLEVRHQGYRSGEMAVHQMEQRPGVLVLRTMSIPVAAQAKHTKAWESITLPALVMEIATRYGYKTLFLDPPTAVYSRVDQVGRGDFAFLAERARLEGCHIKVSNGQVVLYSDQWVESQPLVCTLGPGDLVEEHRLGVQSTAYGSCTVAWKRVTGTYADPTIQGPPLLVSDLPVTSQMEAERFARNLLWNANCGAWGGTCTTLLNISITAGNTLRIQGLGLADGIYCIDSIVHAFVEGVSDLQVHRIERRSGT